MPSLSEGLLLLALDDEKGSVGINASTTLDTALAGGQLMDLALLKRIDIRDDRVVVVDPLPVKDTVLNDALTRLREESKPKKASSMIPKLTRGLRKKLLAQLADKGIVEVSERRILGFIPIERHPEADGSVEDALRTGLREVILNHRDPDEKTTCLAALLKAAGLESLILSREEKKASKERLKQIASGEALSPAIAKAVASVNAATMAAVVAAGAAAASSGS